MRRDYQLMRDMYLTEPVSFDDILTTLSDLEHRINLVDWEETKNSSLINSQREIKEFELPQNNIAPLPSLGEALTKKRGDELVQSVMEILAAGANVNDTSFNGHRPLQLLIKARLDARKKLELVNRHYRSRG